VGSEKTLKLGSWKIPLAGGTIENLRRGTPFWEVLEERGVETTIMRMPANYPPSGTATRELSGMGTPDLLGTLGFFSFYTSELFAFGGKDLTGGKVYEAWPEEGVVRATLYGPDNPFLVDKKKLATDFEVYLDEVDPVAKLVIGDEERVLEVGEWSDWVPFSFEMIPTQTLNGVCRFYLRQVRPEFELYVSPLNIDPLAPALPISTPGDYAAELAERTGRFYTQGMPEDTKTLTDGVFQPQEFLDQANIAGSEVADQYPPVLDEFLGRSGDRLLFYYFGNVDQVSHVMFRATDPEHPAYDPEIDAPFADILERLYRWADGVVGETLDRIGDDTRLVVMSDHGFAPWRRAFNLNSWLRDNGYLAVKNPNLRKDPGLFVNVDWSRTRAYGVGFNGLYINLRGREKRGIVAPEEFDALLAEIGRNLLETIDPKTGMPAVTKVYPAREYFEYQGAVDVGPDILVGYAKSTRASHETVLGELQPEVFSDNTDAWSGDHGMDHQSVPGILLTDGPLAKPATSLMNLAAAIVAEFGVEEFPPPDQR
jgi:predicted AlkP superfamily phosphohydrolase/phosphomutase